VSVGSAPAGSLGLTEFFEGVRTGRVSVQRCRSCGALAVPPKAYCPGCRGTTWERQPLTGDGEVASFTVIHVPPGSLAAQGPYAIAIVRMAEGVSLLGRLDGLPVEALRIGLAVRLVAPADPAATPPVITFRPAP
jgi:3-oxo-4,17-pregnadiene-20-carboxyl-CoA hydratase alpha subunit